MLQEETNRRYPEQIYSGVDSNRVAKGSSHMDEKDEGMDKYDLIMDEILNIKGRNHKYISIRDLKSALKLYNQRQASLKDSPALYNMMSRNDKIPTEALEELLAKQGELFEMYVGNGDRKTLYDGVKKLTGDILSLENLPPYEERVTEIMYHYLCGIERKLELEFEY